MASVVREPNTLRIVSLLMQSADNVPRMILAAVIDENNSAILICKPPSTQCLKLVEQNCPRLLQDLFFVIAGNDNR